ncbi:hypothetical protein MMC11_004620 [Xylographa trunciseda]|nr:hypothetical protein [Xylographa trunciseda]
MASTLQSAERGPFSFFWFPVEIRCLIYQQLLDAHEDGAINVANEDPFHKIVPIFPSILRTCRTVYTEAIGILYKINTFHLESNRQQPFPPPELLFGGIRTTDLLHNVQLIISDHELLSEIVPKRHDTYRLVKELNRSQMPKGSFSIAFQKCGNAELDSTPIAVAVTNILVQSIRSLSNFKEVVVVGLSFDDQGHPAKMIWSRAFRRELESGLGPNYSVNDRRLEFRPRSNPRHWIRENISPLMRLPSSVRSRIIGHVLGSGPFMYPSHSAYDLQQSGHHPDWDMVATVARCNPGKDLSLLFTCRKLWEEGWQRILLYKHIVFDFDFDAVNGSICHDSSAQNNATWLPNTTVILRNLDNPTNIRSTSNHFEILLKGLSKRSANPFVARPIPERGQLILRIGILQPRWRRYPRDKKIRPTREEYKANRKSYHPDIYYTELQGVPYINAKNGHDIEIGKFLKQMTEWKRIDIVLLPETLRSHCWRREVTDHLEDTLGPQLSPTKGYLSFRPRYFRNLKLLLSRRDAYKFMLGRKHFSQNVTDDLLERASHNSNDGNDNDSGNGNDDNSGVEGVEGPTNDEQSSSDVEFSDDHRRVIDAINEYELAEGLRLSALEASVAGYSLGSEDDGDSA